MDIADLYMNLLSATNKRLELSNDGLGGFLSRADMKRTKTKSQNQRNSLDSPLNQDVGYEDMCEISNELCPTLEV